ncbi:MAG: hypothetical protein WEA10_06055 [Actinomycetota bacterium]
MATCSVCGTSLSPAIAWCSQCFTPIANMRSDMVPRRTTPRQIASPVITLQGRQATRFGPHDVVIVPQSPTVTFRPARSRPEPERPSLLRGGPTSFGIVGKSVITLITVGIGVALWLGLQTFRAGLGDSMRALQFTVLGAYVLLALVLLWFTWRPEPHASRVRVATAPARVVPRPDMRLDPSATQRDDAWS